MGKGDGEGVEMNIYKISQKENNSYDSFDSAVVVAENAAKARRMDPRTGDVLTKGIRTSIEDYWVFNDKKVQVELIGKASKGRKRGVIVSSFNAG